MRSFVTGCLIIAAVLASAARTSRAESVTVGNFQFELRDGWERAPANFEGSSGGWMFGYVKGPGGASRPIVVIFSRENAPFASEEQRNQYLAKLRDGLRAKHGATFRADKMTLAGVSTDRYRFVQDEETLFYLSPYNGERVFLIVVTVPAKDAPFPSEAAALLSTLKLSGPAYKPPARKAGPLDGLLRDLEKLDKGLDKILDAVKEKPKSADQPPDGKQPPDTRVPPADKSEEKTKTDTLPGSSRSTPDGARVRPPNLDVGIALDPTGNVKVKGLGPNDLLWSPPATKPPERLESEALRLPVLLDVGALGRLQYAGGAATALAAMRELAGPLAPEEEDKLDAKWAPYLRMPPAGGEEYFEKLNGILQETLALRTAVATASAEFDAAWEEAVVAASYDSEEGVREALAIGHSQRRILVAAQARLAVLARQAAALGNPPNAVEANKQSRRAHESALRAVRELLPAPPAPAGAWVLKRVTRLDKMPGQEAASARIGAVMADTAFRYQATTNYTQRLGGEDVRFTGEFLLDLSWKPFPVMIPGGSTITLSFNYTRRRTGNDISQLRRENTDNLGVASDVFLRVNPRERTLIDLYGKAPQIQKGYMLGIAPGIEPKEEGTKTLQFVAPAGQPGKTARLQIFGDINGCQNDYTLQGRAEFYRIFEYAWTTNPKEIAEAGREVREGPSDDETRHKQEAMAFHDANIKIIQRNLEKDRADLEKETDPSRRAALEMRILQAESDLMAEQDLIASIETGQLVHRRTPFEDYARDRFIQSIRENQVEMEQFQRASAALQRLAGMLPAGEAEEARRFIDRQMAGDVLAKMDIEAVRKMAHALNEKVQGYVQRDRARADHDEAWAQYNLETAERFKSAADKGMFVCSLFGGRGVMIAYQAATGYVEGGPTETVLRTAAWAGTPAYVASEAFRGYYRTDEQGNPRGWLGAAADAGKAYVMAKLFEYGASKAKQWATGRGPDGLTAAERTQLAEFQRGRTAGELKAREFARAQADLERAARQGASPQVISRLQANCRKAAAGVHADPHAKNYLKYKGDFHAQRAYNAHMRANHAEVEGKFHDLMRRKGWNQQPLREFRNAASGDSVGMDHDIGLDEEAASRLLRNGRPASVYQWQQDAQKAWDEAYAQVTGQSAKRSWETVTTSVHAESYRDLNWLGRDKSNIQRVWGQQAADVTRYKNWHMLNDPSLGKFTALQEVSRGTAKDIGTKLKSLLDAAKPQTPASAAALQQARRHWTKVQSILEAFGNNTIDPVYASRRIREVTGGKDIPQVVEEAAMLMESLAKQVGK